MREADAHVKRGCSWSLQKYAEWIEETALDRQKRPVIK
jgi:hypothetical protein